MSRDYKKVHAWQMIDDLVMDVYKLTRTFPKEELYGLTSQFRRAIVSAAANIVEGSGRKTDRDYLQFLGIAFSSLEEAGYYLHLSLRLGYLSEEHYKDLIERFTLAAKTLRAFMTHIEGSLKLRANR